MRYLASMRLPSPHLSLLVVLAGCGDSTGGDGDGGSTTGTTVAMTDGSTAGAASDATSPVADTTTTTGPGEDDTSTTGSGQESSESSSGGPTGSPGCGNPRPPSGSLVMEVEGQMGEYIVSLPPGYDPSTPYPLGFGFHGRNRTGPNCQDGDCAGFQDAMGD